VAKALTDIAIQNLKSGARRYEKPAAGRARKLNPLSKMQHTRGLILLFLDTVGRPARTSEIRKAVLRWFPEAAVYGSMLELQCSGEIKRLTHERDALFAIVMGKAS
jgi:hypothetical protein